MPLDVPEINTLRHEQVALRREMRAEVEALRADVGGAYDDAAAHGVRILGLEARAEAFQKEATTFFTEQWSMLVAGVSRAQSTIDAVGATVARVEERQHEGRFMSLAPLVVSAFGLGALAARLASMIP